MKTNKEEIESIIHSGDTVFHYTAMSTAIDILWEKNLFFSQSIKTNDPREYRDWFFTTLGSNPVHSRGRSSIDLNTYKEDQDVSSIINRIIKKEYKLACFCSNRLSNPTTSNNISNQTPQYGYDRMRMWSQYGEEHRGICIAFSKSALQQELRNKMGPTALISADNVEYRADLHIYDHLLKKLDERSRYSKDKEKNANNFVQEHLKEIFFLKDVDFISENEYRIVVYDPRDDALKVDISKCLRAIILGDNFKEVYKKLVEDMCDNLNVACKQFTWLAGKLRL